MLMLALRSSGLQATRKGTSTRSGARRPTSVAWATLRLKASRARRPPWRVNPTSLDARSEASHVYPVPQPPPQSGSGVPETTVPSDTGSGGKVPGTKSSWLRTPAWPSRVQNGAPLRTGAYAAPSRQMFPIQRADGLSCKVAACGVPVAGSGVTASKTPWAPGLVPVANEAHAEADSAPGVEVTRTRPDTRANSARCGNRPSAIKWLRISGSSPSTASSTSCRVGADAGPQAAAASSSASRPKRDTPRILYWRECGFWASTMVRAGSGWR